ncbi:MAG: TlpA family protein disulfide reductase [Nitrospirae bacterium]|nr:MAG: TlpA family protein disulfide reductase [Nitrospirota bacterium]
MVKKVIIIIVILIIAGAGSADYLTHRVPFDEQPPKVGEAAPEIGLTDLGGTMHSLSDYKGKTIIVNFWATWCPPCKDQLQLFQRFYDEYEKDGLVILAFAIDHPDMKLVSELGLTYPVFEVNERVKKAYGSIKSVPATFVIDPEGSIVEKTRRYYSEKTFRSLLTRYLKANEKPGT